MRSSCSARRITTNDYLHERTVEKLPLEPSLLPFIKGLKGMHHYLEGSLLVLSAENHIRFGIPVAVLLLVASQELQKCTRLRVIAACMLAGQPAKASIITQTSGLP